ncbi:Hpt domain-containing protein [Alteromonas sp. ASW11-130]|uniref:Hpt domain-containing protein n=1 Tax=Alteromonas sp. ASW11-130 TaxID=3015775 RepID=UPI002241965C|nr:Hpt domain-containing protein [Alteromonas sp. ASW11-130]MCW8093122.1 Hpt domain-containing protein [Alteromonas sp. ASW11-130]
MSNTQTVIDLEFGIAQLSGNKSLLFTLLKKFADEYAETEQKLNNMFENEEWESARALLHTLKGVTGNLGINALHHESKDVEDYLKAHTGVPPSYPIFLSILRETLETIDKLGVEPAPTSSVSSSSTPNANEDKDDFLRALKNSEFIPEDQLGKWIKAATSDTSKQQAIKDAVDELDYQRAIDLVNA